MQVSHVRVRRQTLLIWGLCVALSVCALGLALFFSTYSVSAKENDDIDECDKIGAKCDDDKPIEEDWVTDPDGYYFEISCNDGERRLDSTNIFALENVGEQEVRDTFLHEKLGESCTLTWSCLNTPTLSWDSSEHGKSGSAVVTYNGDHSSDPGNLYDYWGDYKVSGCLPNYRNSNGVVRPVPMTHHVITKPEIKAFDPVTGEELGKTDIDLGDDVLIRWSYNGRAGQHSNGTAASPSGNWGTACAIGSSSRVKGQWRDYTSVPYSWLLDNIVRKVFGDKEYPRDSNPPDHNLPVFTHALGVGGGSERSVSLGGERLIENLFIDPPWKDSFYEDQNRAGEQIRISCMNGYQSGSDRDAFINTTGAVFLSRPSETLSIEAVPDVIPKGTNTRIEWWSDNTVKDSCVVTATNGDTWTADGTRSSKQSENTRIINQKETYTLTCKNFEQEDVSVSTDVNIRDCENRSGDCDEDEDIDAIKGRCSVSPTSVDLETDSGEVTWIATGVSGGDGNYDYDWTIRKGSTVVDTSNDREFDATYTDDGVYEATLRISSGNKTPKVTTCDLTVSDGTNGEEADIEFYPDRYRVRKGERVDITLRTENNGNCTVTASGDTGSNIAEFPREFIADVDGNISEPPFKSHELMTTTHFEADCAVLDKDFYVIVLDNIKEI